MFTYKKQVHIQPLFSWDVYL